MIDLDRNQAHQILHIDANQLPQGLRGKITIPGDKSISHRSLMLGSVAEGETTIRGLLLGEDPRSTAACFAAMGAEISELNSELVTVKGIGLGNLKEPLDVLNAGNSGTTLRLMLGILASHPDRFFTVTGDASLRSRPMSRVVNPLRQMGAHIWGRENGARAPLAVSGQNLKAIHYQSPVASAQVKSCLMLAGLMTDGETTITEPERSRDHSERMLAAFGANVRVDIATNTVIVKGGAKLIGQEVTVPGDISSAAFWLVAASIVPDSDLLIENVGINPTRTGILEVLAEMGADITYENQREVTGEPVADLRVRSAHLKGCRIGGAVIPRLIDEIPILAIAAACAEGTTIIEDAAELRVKESDRIVAMVQELTKLGANVTEHPDGMEIVGGKILTGTEVDSYDDHRVAMSLAIAALVAKGKTIINRAESAAISYPSFIPTLQGLYN
ncbi:3-phosphoshikimate 1-carboxyvinyltransferase [Pseudanabaena sp. FACHB-1277]|uniref:3-phosphoshikimate 1-carboxyvinyltransferase n=1 Tax=Pseudanabaena cinerea FACHB-1277 TaxID=2949581 RepID=A0A926UXB3_9CYAN|nr:3-phosphoshikimate 1-carboxyvinyltransferase [Pseudanabaena cinerea]MBD2151692.1 3-phosphoshikimate 1-carboxyvinyltransferase [Pseudanabaena cinerea FACHB-1277]